jgi:hypothetical protein
LIFPTLSSTLVLLTGSYDIVYDHVAGASVVADRGASSAA